MERGGEILGNDRPLILKVELSYPRKLEFHIPTTASSEFSMKSNFYGNEYFNISGNISEIHSGNVNIAYELQASILNVTSKSNSEGTYKLNSKSSFCVVSSIYGINPMLYIYETTPPNTPSIMEISSGNVIFQKSLK